jgi:hypothetical protein
MENKQKYIVFSLETGQLYTTDKTEEFDGLSVHEQITIYKDTKLIYQHNIKKGTDINDSDMLDMKATLDLFENKITSTEGSDIMEVLEAEIKYEYLEYLRKTCKLGRNDLCYCEKKKVDGTPMKYKNCCGKLN